MEFIKNPINSGVSGGICVLCAYYNKKRTRKDRHYWRSFSNSFKASTTN